MFVFIFSPGYKPFLNIIKPQLQKLSEVTVEQVQPEVFQPTVISKVTEQCSPRAEESRSSTIHSPSPQSDLGSGNVSRHEENVSRQEQDESLQEGSYDCIIS